MAQGRQSGLKTGCVIDPDLKIEGVVGNKNSTEQGHIAQDWAPLTGVCVIHWFGL